MIRLSDDLKTVCNGIVCFGISIARSLCSYLGNDIQSSFVDETREEIVKLISPEESVLCVVFTVHAIIGTNDKCFKRIFLDENLMFHESDDI